MSRRDCEDNPMLPIDDLSDVIQAMIPWIMLVVGMVIGAAVVMLIKA